MSADDRFHDREGLSAVVGCEWASRVCDIVFVLGGPRDRSARRLHHDHRVPGGAAFAWGGQAPVGRSARRRRATRPIARPLARVRRVAWGRDRAWTKRRVRGRSRGVRPTEGRYHLPRGGHVSHGAGLRSRCRCRRAASCGRQRADARRLRGDRREVHGAQAVVVFDLKVRYSQRSSRAPRTDMIRPGASPGP